MTTRNVLITLAGAAVVTGAVACGGSSTTSGTPQAQSRTATTTSTSSAAPATTSVAPSTPVAGARSTCDELGGKVGPDQVCKVHTETSTYTVDMSFPVGYPDQSALTDALKQERDQFISAVEEPPVRDVPHKLDMTGETYRSGTPSSGTESLVFEMYENTGGAHPETYYKALTFDLGKRAPITLDTLFKPGSDPVAVLDPLMKAQWAKLLEGEPVEDNLIGAQMYENFALTDDAVIFFIGQGMWEYEAVGPQQFSIPRSKLVSILA